MYLHPLQRELETLFDRYDEDCSECINYKAFCHHLFGVGEHIAMNSTSRSMIERVSDLFAFEINAPARFEERNKITVNGESTC